MYGKRIFLKFIFLYFLICLALRPQSVTPKFDRIPAIIPNCVFQDSYGFIWIGDQEGLVKYDGYTLKRYKQIPFDSTSLSTNYVTDIKVDSKGNLWVGTHGGGLNYFDQKTEKFTHYLNNPDLPKSLGSNSITKIIINEDGSLWIGTLDNGFTYMNWDNNDQPVYKQYLSREEIPPEIVYYGILDMYQDNQGYLWLGTVGFGLQRLDIVTGEIKSYKHDSKNPDSISHNMVSAICPDDSGNLWLGTGFHVFNTGGGLNKFNRDTEQFTHFINQPDDPSSLGSDIINALLIDRDNGLWIGLSGKGLQYITLSELNTNPKPKFKNVGGSSVKSIYEDRLGNVWISPSSFFVRKIDYQQNPFFYFRHNPDNPNSLSGWGTMSIYIDSKNNIWIGHSYTGISKYNPRTGMYKHYHHLPNNKNSLSENQVKAICEDNDGNIWIGTNANGIDILNPTNDTFTHIKADLSDSTALNNNLIQWLMKSHTGDIWISFNKGGLQLFDAQRKQFIKYDLDPNSIEDEEITALYEEHSGKLWVGTANNGLYAVEFNDQQIAHIEHFTYNFHNTDGLNNSTIYDIIQPQVNDTSALWLATQGGLNRLDLQTKTFTHVTEKEGLASNFILKILEDDQGDIWCTTAVGISRYSSRTGMVRNYGKEDGLPTTGFGTGRVNTAKDKEGRLYFCGGGITAFHPKEIKDNPNIPPISLTDFKVFHESVRLDTTIQFKKRIILNHEQNAFSFDFAALNFTNPAENQYAYKMEGFYDDWIYTGAERTASFTNLDPGDYIFHVKGSNNHGLWNEKGTSIRITIIPPWWRTWRAYLFYTLILGAMLYALRRYDLKRQRLKSELALEHKHAQKLHEIDRMKSRFFANISHEFRTPLTLILGPIEKLLANINNPDSKNELSIMRRNAERLRRLINQLLDLSKLEAGGMTIQVSEVNIIELVYSYVQSFESLAKRKGIDLKFSAEKDYISAFIDREKIEKILNNLLSNAFKYTNEGGLVEVVVGSSSGTTKTDSVYSDLIIIKVSDTGIGIPLNRIDKIFDRFYQIDDSQKREHEGTGIGLALTKELVELHNGQIKVESEVGKGTTFSISLPSGRDHFKDIETVDDQLDTSVTTVKEKEHLPIEETATDYADYSEQPPVSKTGKPIILIVEDNPDMRGYIRGYLDKDYKILEAGDGQQGLDKAIETIPDLIISDVMMPKMDGFELCEKIKTDERTSHIPVILLTARAESEDKIEGLETGADDYLIKPFDAKELLVRIKNLIEQRQKLRDRFYKELILSSQDITAVSIDEKFIYRLIDICHKHLADSSFSIELLGHEVGLSRSQLHRKLKGLTGQSATEFIKTLRLKRAALLMQQHQDNISQIAYEVGFNNLSYFGRSFKELYGQTPSEYLNSEERGLS